MAASETKIVIWFKDGHQEVIESRNRPLELITNMSKTHDNGFVGFEDIDGSITVINMSEIQLMRLIPTGEPDATP